MRFVADVSEAATHPAVRHRVWLADILGPRRPPASLCGVAPHIKLPGWIDDQGGFQEISDLILERCQEAALMFLECFCYPAVARGDWIDDIEAAACRLMKSRNTKIRGTGGESATGVPRKVGLQPEYSSTASISRWRAG